MWFFTKHLQWERQDSTSSLSSRPTSRVLKTLSEKSWYYSPPLQLSLFYFWFSCYLSLHFSASQSSLPSSLPLYYSKTSYGTNFHGMKIFANQINNLVHTSLPIDRSYIHVSKHLTKNFPYLFRRFHDKTHNEWDERESFVKKAGKYDMLAMDYKATVVSVRRRWEGANTPAPA